jgi:hypothetical protein
MQRLTCTMARSYSLCDVISSGLSSRQIGSPRHRTRHPSLLALTTCSPLSEALHYDYVKKLTCLRSRLPPNDIQDDTLVIQIKAKAEAINGTRKAVSCLYHGPGSSFKSLGTHPPEFHQTAHRTEILIATSAIG